MNTTKLFTATALTAALLTASGCKDDNEKENAAQAEANRTEIVVQQDTDENPSPTTTFGEQSGGFQSNDSFSNLSNELSSGRGAEEPRVETRTEEPESVVTSNTGSKFMDNPYAQVTQDDMLYEEIEGNEFTMTFRTAVFPQGRQVTIDPDDMMPVNDPRKDGRVVLAPRQRFFYEINNQLPAIPGREMARLGPNEGLSPKGASTMYKHLTDDPMLGRNGEVIGGGHGIPRDQIEEAMIRTHEARGIPEPD